jgi:hypothetical protein
MIESNLLSMRKSKNMIGHLFPKNTSRNHFGMKSLTRYQSKKRRKKKLKMKAKSRKVVVPI